MKKITLVFLNLILVLTVEAQSQLTINFDNVDGLTPRAILSFPDKSTKIITESTTIDISQEGNYSVECSMVRKSNTIVDELFICSPQSINVTALDKNYSLNLSYQKVNGTGSLVVPTSNQEISIFGFENLLSKNNEADFKINSEREILLVASDTSGNIWFWDREGLNKINHEDLASGDVAVEKRFTVPNAYNALFNCNAMRIDNKNRMWMSLMHENVLIVVDIDKIANDGEAKPICILTTRFATTDFAISNDASQIAVSGIGGFMLFNMPASLSTNFIELSPICKSHDAGTFTAVDFDAEGNLWTTSENGGIFKFDKSSLTKAELKTDEAALEIITREYVYWGIKLDNSNNIWAMSRFEDGAYGIDFFEVNGLSKESQPTHQFVFPRNTVNGKFTFSGSNFF